MALTVHAHLQPGYILHNTYRIEKVLGQGGFGITYLATDLSLERMVAVKEFFPQDFCDRDGNTSGIYAGTRNNESLVERLKIKFLKEARNIARLNYPGIIRIYAAFEENNTAYYVMEYIDGCSLADLVGIQGPLPENEALHYVMGVGNALEYVHRQHITHLDVKPANIMIRRSNNEPVLIDFGLAKKYDREGHQTSATPTGISQGFAPMEQYVDNGISDFSPQTDIYSLAATLYFALTATVPPAANLLIDGDLRFPPYFPAGLVKPIQKAMAVSRKNRHQTIDRFLDVLRANYQPGPVRPLPPMPRPMAQPVPPMQQPMHPSQQPMPYSQQQPYSQQSQPQYPQYSQPQYQGSQYQQYGQMPPSQQPMPYQHPGHGYPGADYNSGYPHQGAPVQEHTVISRAGFDPSLYDQQPTPPQQAPQPQQPQYQQPYYHPQQAPYQQQVPSGQPVSQSVPPVQPVSQPQPPVQPISQSQPNETYQREQYPAEPEENFVATDVEDDEDTPKKNRTGLWIGIVAAVLAVGAGVFFLLSNSGPKVEEVTNYHLEDYEWDSPLGKAIYHGHADGTIVHNTDGTDDLSGLTPNGHGRFEIIEGEFKGNIYVGEIENGMLEGHAIYTLANGDVFEGEFCHDKYEEGKYTKSTGQYFEGTFFNGVPDQGNWYNKDGKKM